MHVCNSNCYYFSSLGHDKDVPCLGNKFLEPFAQIAHICYKDIQFFETTKQIYLGLHHKPYKYISIYFFSFPQNLKLKGSLLIETEKLMCFSVFPPKQLSSLYLFARF